MEKTTITPSPISICTTSWWGRLGRLLLLAIPFLVSCEDEPSPLGFKAEQKRFTLHYAEIPLHTGMIAFDSIPSECFYDGTTSRWLAGAYHDPLFGTVSATTLAQFVPSATTISVNNPVYDSATLDLELDLYVYGSKDVISQSFEVHELNAQMNDTLAYYNTSSVPYKAGVISSGTFSFDVPLILEKKKSSSAVDSTFVIHLKLSNAFGNQLFDKVEAGDTIIKNSELFRQEYPGLALVATDANLIAGFNPQSGNSRLTLHYHTPDEDSLWTTFSLARKCFVHYDFDRSGTSIAPISGYKQLYNPIDGRVFTQAGTSIQALVDFSPLFEGTESLFDTIPRMLINSAQLVITPEISNTYDLPQSFVLRLLSASNGYQPRSTELETQVKAYYDAALVAPVTSNFLYMRPVNNLIVGDDFYQPTQARPSYIALNSDMTEYSGYVTQYVQSLFEAGPDNLLYRFALSPSSPEQGKAVSRMVFEEGDLRLRIYYTVPTTENSQ